MELPKAVTEGLTKLAPTGVALDEPMSRHTSFGLGGAADVLIDPPDEASFKNAAALLADERVPTRVLGRGTNVLVRSGGIEGAVLIAGASLGRLERAGNTVVAGSGVPLARLLSFCAGEGLAGLEGLAGIPGSIGGAVVMNAGSHGVTVGERLTKVVTFEPGKSSRAIDAAELEFGYRSTSLPSRAIVESVSLELERGDPDDIRACQREMLDRKWRAQPCGMRSAGCIFKNPSEAPAGLLIDQAGLKGTRVGGAVVSDQHANFIVNDRGATADDVEELIQLVRDRVREGSGVELELEIEVIGRRAN